jgi:hypothetical protein
MKRTLLFACCVSSALAGCGEESGPASMDTTASSTADVTAVSHADWLDPTTGTTYVMNPNRRVVLREGELAPQTRELPGNVAEVRGAVNSHGFDSDWSGQLQTQVVECVSGQTTGSISIGCTVGSDFVLVGGGAQDVWTGAGAMLWESRPQDVNDSGPGATWLASSKDQVQAALHSLHVWAIGLRVMQTNGVFLTQPQLKSHISYTFCAGMTPSNQPDQTCGRHRPMLIGGGARSEWQATNGAGQLLTRSFGGFQLGSTGWEAQSKDQIVSDPATVDATAISMDTSIFGVGNFAFGLVNGNTAVVSSGIATSTAMVDAGAVAVGFGGISNWVVPSAGRLLYRMSFSDNTLRGMTVSSKDHIQASAGNLTGTLFEMAMAR